ncbi:class I SAM-dependent methyltransferase [Frigidibacter sp. ROC022]|uniref:class I SAM-dependent methyltransferase n=1 Tax=Frigidibacter sp. ROC022 TaxID=2971796 RepID=UPI00215ABAD1|nr:class I SAM-dependent methyltransferase [Frigidibacter sp. ROC022]MCR8724586.1 class I SAM-dependent methyltransferase [Frigidibacter sp. ROC022]
MADPKSTVYPETLAGGFTRVDGTIQFFTRIRALLEPGFTVLDLGAGRGQAFHGDKLPFRKALRQLRGHCAEVIGCDPDPVVLTNPSLDRAFLMGDDGRLDLDEASIDLILCDFVLEHVADPGAFVSEVHRVLRPGGWFCARTPNKWGYIALGSRIIPERLHSRVLRRAQPDRKAEDVFPTLYRLNTRSALRSHFPRRDWLDGSYVWNAEPAYFGRSVLAWRLASVALKFLPQALGSMLMVFMQKRGPSAGIPAGPARSNSEPQLVNDNGGGQDPVPIR